MGRSKTKAECLIEMERLYLQRAFSDAEMAERIGVDRTTAYRYRMELSSGESSLMIVQDAYGKWKIDRSTYLSNLRVNLYESLSLYLAAKQTLQQSRMAGIHAVNALEKLSMALHQPMTSRLVDEANKVLNSRIDPQKMKVFETIARGWAERIVVDILYRGLHGQQERRYRIQPYLIEPSAWSDSVYVIAHSHEFGNVVPFKIERISRAVLSTEQFEIPDDFDRERLLRYAWGIWRKGGNPEIVRLKFRPGAAARRLLESTWHPLEKVQETPDGGCIWEAPIAEWREMLPWVRGWGADVEVLAPSELRKRLLQEVRRLGRIYDLRAEDKDKDILKYYAHSRVDADESEWQLLIDHLTGTAELAAKFGEAAGIPEIAWVTGMLHDIGKYSSAFQSRLRGSSQHVDHSSAGAKEIVKLFAQKQTRYLAEIVSYCIAGHHTGLLDYGSQGDLPGAGTLVARRDKKRINNYDAYKKEIDVSSFVLEMQPILAGSFRQGGKERSYTGFSLSFFTRMLYSMLVDADWLDTEKYMSDVEKPRGRYASIDALAKQFNQFLQRFENPQSELDKKRTDTLHACLDRAISSPGFFTLTVPTGGGKTFSSMAFALNHAVRHGLQRIIYVIPYTSIIEQNAAKFREALGVMGKENVLEHHSNFDWKRALETDDETDELFAKMKLAAENWDIPIVVTTNVQFFESLFANKKRQVRKLHNLAKSILIFDEVQMLPREFLKPCLLAIQELVRNYGCSAVFCTATQPALEGFFPKEIQFTELAPKPDALYKFYKRVEIKQLGELPDDELISRLNEHEQVLCIVNTRRHAKELFNQLAYDGRYHLSTLMCSTHRYQVLKRIYERLGKGEICRVVSTQVMEAGIDIDFPVGYRALAGLDEIIQAAGRVNREMKRANGDLFVFEPKSEYVKRTPSFIAQTSAVARSVWRDFKEDPDSLEAIAAFYQMLYTLQDPDGFDANHILDYFSTYEEHPEFNFKTAAEHFHLIRQNTVSVLVPYDETAETLLRDLEYAVYPGGILRKLQRYVVNIYEHEFENIQSKGGIITINDTYQVLNQSRMNEFYNAETGLILPVKAGGTAICF